MEKIEPHHYLTVVAADERFIIVGLIAFRAFGLRAIFSTQLW
jgi:hypothetical protein